MNWLYNSTKWEETKYSGGLYVRKWCELCWRCKCSGRSL